MSGTSLIVGAGSGLSASLARKLAARGSAVHLAARNTEKLAELAAETKATTHACDATDPQAVDALFAAVGEPDFVVYNASGRSCGDFVDLDRDAVRKAIEVSAYAGFLVAHSAARIMVPKGSGAIFFTGASASVKGYSRSAPLPSPWPVSSRRRESTLPILSSTAASAASAASRRPTGRIPCLTPMPSPKPT